MHFVSIRELRANSAEIQKRLLSLGDMVITSNGKPVAILSPTSEEGLEDSLASLRRARAASALASMHKHALDRGLNKMSLKEINAEIAAARKKRAL